ncbi:zinc ribbon domain-containing protein [Plantactinospora sp. S1510]|uniref:Zinc ribbon domain-containing protein n=1 Tax=Plantactinospora alkalitolerans TaxID=2789879 RepID=A0ABS0GUG7_9ACTN|nr:FmdB family zinc ribbon protein [Plantactinospora alkalitolerans]MBF9129609.1 zinc ribbon domain-containing protein [Plantactinospora alkalitolerans]
MATYEYRCPRDGAFDAAYPIGQAPPRTRCATCSAEADRVFSAPLLNAVSRPLTAALDRAARSAEAPEVVSRIPGRRGTPTRPNGPTHPGHARLPRP